MSLPPGLHHYVQAVLWPEFRRRVQQQVAFRDVDGPMPWPEELERPGWKVWHAVPGDREMEVAVAEPLEPGLVTDGQVVNRAAGGVHTERISAVLEDEVETNRGRWWVGLGWSVPRRLLVVFVDPMLTSQQVDTGRRGA